MSAPLKAELEILQNFREAIKDLDLNEEDRSDDYLIRWLRARDLDIKAADAMIRKHIAWRMNNQVDEILHWHPPRHMEENFPYDIDGLDKDGCPVMTLPFGQWDVRKILESGHAPLYERYFIRCMEKAMEKLREINKRRPVGQKITQIVVIDDFAGYTFRQMASKSAIEMTLKMIATMEDNYPEFLKAAIVVNAPRIFTVLFSMVKPLMTQHTQSKIKVFGTNCTKWKPHLLARIPADQLLQPYGGMRMLSQDFLKLYGSPVLKEIENGDSLCEISVGAGQKLQMDVAVKRPNSNLSWKFKTDHYDIGFSIENEKGQFLVAPALVDSHLNLQAGSLEGLNKGKYIITFDNTHSRMRSKALHYSLTLPPDDIEDEETSF